MNPPHYSASFPINRKSQSKIHSNPRPWLKEIYIIGAIASMIERKAHYHKFLFC
jgi:hypothetical protein